MRMILRRSNILPNDTEILILKIFFYYSSLYFFLLIKQNKKRCSYKEGANRASSSVSIP